VKDYALPAAFLSILRGRVGTLTKKKKTENNAIVISEAQLQNAAL